MCVYLCRCIICVKQRRPSLICFYKIKTRQEEKKKGVINKVHFSRVAVTGVIF